MDTFGTVIYVGTFTKILFNALRIRFMVLPGELVSVFEAARNFMDRSFRSHCAVSGRWRIDAPNPRCVQEMSTEAYRQRLALKRVGGETSQHTMRGRLRLKDLRQGISP
jgi:DNA-binding transcriptional MocR family regulator